MTRSPDRFEFMAEHYQQSLKDGMQFRWKVNVVFMTVMFGIIVAATKLREDPSTTLSIEYASASILGVLLALWVLIVWQHRWSKQLRVIIAKYDRLVDAGRKEIEEWEVADFRNVWSLESDGAYKPTTIATPSLLRSFMLFCFPFFPPWEKGLDAEWFSRIGNSAVSVLSALATCLYIYFATQHPEPEVPNGHLVSQAQVASESELALPLWVIASVLTLIMVLTLIKVIRDRRV